MQDVQAVPLGYTARVQPDAELEHKQTALFESLRALDSVIVALSGGADSAYLAWAAHQMLGERALAVTALSASFSAYDREQLALFLAATRVPHLYLETQEVSDPRYAANPADRCYFCKDELFRVLDALAAERGISSVAYAIHSDDAQDFRPGHRAAVEHAVLAPLLDCRLGKTEIRELSRRAGLPTWDRPASACLSSRIPFGTPVTPQVLGQIERAEAAVRALGFRQFRVRHHGQLARIEIACEEMPRALDPAMAQFLAAAVSGAGYTYVTLDLEGYRQGSLQASLQSRTARAAASAEPPSDAQRLRILK
jgi:pyridinium-3,5-biscarboxylic acid mononucleotide sulfurtransferase